MWELMPVTLKRLNGLRKLVVSWGQCWQPKGPTLGTETQPAYLEYENPRHSAGERPGARLLGLAASLLLPGALTNITGKDVTESLPSLAVEFHKLHLFDWKKVVRTRVDLDARQQHLA